MGGEGVGVQALYGSDDGRVVAAALHVIAGYFHNFVDEGVGGGRGGERKERSRDGEL
jgi:hypothetical protein